MIPENTEELPMAEDSSSEKEEQFFGEHLCYQVFVVDDSLRYCRVIGVTTLHL